MTTERLENIKKAAFAVVLITISVILLADAKNAVNGAREGIKMCGETVIASLFVFMIISETAYLSGVFSSGRLSGKLMGLLRLPEEAFCCVLFAFIGGYPVGLRLIKKSYASGRISVEDARRMSSFCVNAGPGFIVNTVGAAVFGSVGAGVAVLVCTTLSSVCVAVAGALLAEKKKYKNHAAVADSEAYPDAFVNAVSSSVSGILSVCGWIILFSALRSVVEGWISGGKVEYTVRMLSEVTDGVSAAAELGGLPLCAAAVSFGGICVGMQVYPMLREMKIKLSYYFLTRTVCAVLSFIFACMAVRFVLPSGAGEVFAGLAPAFSTRTPCSAFLLVAAGIIVIGEIRGDSA